MRTARRTAIVRDVIEVVAIIIAGFWAFYVFVYENRIKPSFENPDVNVTASMQRLGERNGLVAVGMRVDLHNLGSVKTNFIGIAINVSGERVVPSTPPPPPQRPGSHYVFNGFYRTQGRTTVYTLAYVTRTGDPPARSSNRSKKPWVRSFASSGAYPRQRTNPYNGYQ